MSRPRFLGLRRRILATLADFSWRQAGRQEKRRRPELAGLWAHTAIQCGQALLALELQARGDLTGQVVELAD